MIMGIKKCRIYDDIKYVKIIAKNNTVKKLLLKNQWNNRVCELVLLIQNFLACNFFRSKFFEFFFTDLNSARNSASFDTYDFLKNNIFGSY
jgi:hypothetical protein